MNRNYRSRPASLIASAVFALCLAAAAAPQGLAQKKKVKEKHFEPVARQNLGDYAGRYVGIEDEYVVEVGVGEGGRLSVTSREGKREARLEDLRIDGARVSATKVYADGGRAEFAATFVDRVLNGEREFGLMVEKLRVELPGLSVTQMFYRRVSE
ncbi:MAG TPA: hypothetical protein VM864_03580 [Pyrinomonadaceae bacterium]|jgi:hypothetical protein|nr:hypothetical protein [Pyrinomonadaceae bacterium]